MADDRRSSLDPTVRLSAYRFGAAGLWPAGRAARSDAASRACSGAGDGPAWRCVARVRPDLARS
jgi:hypothetical protein